jgi:phage minor structural protein
MQIPKYIEIKTADGKISAFLSPKADGLKDVYVDCRLNGESTLEFQLPATSEKLAELTPECQIWAGGRVYSLLKDDAIDIVRDENNKLWAKVMAVERWMDLDYQFPEPYICNDPTITNPADLTVIIVGGGTDLSGGRYAVGTAGHALYAVLNGSGWSVGTVDVPGIHDLEMEKASRLELIKQIQEIWGGYLVWDSINKTVSLRSGDIWQPYNGFQIRYKKNLKHITRTQSNKIYTKIYPFGHDNLDIASVNGGMKYITNYSYTSRTYVGIYKNQDIYDAQELKDKATAELALNCRPRYNYKVKIADLRTLPEYNHEDFTVGDMADVIDPDVSPDSPRPRILRHRYNLFQPWNCEIELGDPEERLIEDLKASFDTSDFVGSVFNSIGKLSGQSIENLTITTEKIANLAITADKIVKGTITGSKIASLTITNSNIANLTITGGKIANATITDAKIVSLSADKITAGTIKATISIEGPIITGGTINGGTINGVIINGGTITGSLIRTDVPGYDRIEMDNWWFACKDSSDRFHGALIDIGMAKIDFYYRGDIKGTIEATSGTFDIYPNSSIDMTIGNSYCITYAYGGWCFNDEIGFFGAIPVSQQTAQRLSSSATLSDVIIKINGILDKLGSYGLFYVYN